MRAGKNCIKVGVLLLTLCVLSACSSASSDVPRDKDVPKKSTSSLVDDTPEAILKSLVEAMAQKQPVEHFFAEGVKPWHLDKEMETMKFTGAQTLEETDSEARLSFTVAMRPQEGGELRLYTFFTRLKRESGQWKVTTISLTP